MKIRPQDIERLDTRRASMAPLRMRLQDAVDRRDTERARTIARRNARALKHYTLGA